MNIVLAGNVGSGKGTIANLIKNEYGYPNISTGQLFRDSIEKKEAIGLEAKTYMDKGVLVPLDLTLKLLKARIEQKDCKKGFTLDGFPRSVEQCEALDKMIKIDTVFYIDLPESELIRRQTNRRMCPKCGKIENLDWLKGSNKCTVCGEGLIVRDDDHEDRIKIRLKTMSPKAVVKHYKQKGLLSHIDIEKVYKKNGFTIGSDGGEGTKAVFAEVKKIIDRIAK